MTDMRYLEKDAAKAKGYKARALAEQKLEQAFNAGFICPATVTFTYQRKADGRWIPMAICGMNSKSVIGALIHRGIYVTN